MCSGDGCTQTNVTTVTADPNSEDGAGNESEGSGMEEEETTISTNTNASSATTTETIMTTMTSVEVFGMEEAMEDDEEVVFDEEEIVPVTEESQLEGLHKFEGEFGSGSQNNQEEETDSNHMRSREPKFVLAKFVEESELPQKKNQQEPSSASLLSSLLSSLYEEEKQRKAEELKSEEYVYINHQSRSRHIGS